MKINWKLRLQNKTTLVTLITLTITFIYQILSFCDVVPKVSQEEITNTMLILINILVVLGVVVDPTTDGIGDSKQALEYTEPKNLINKELNNMSKICFAIGHGKSAKGGYDSGATYKGYHEFKIAKEIGKYAQEYYNSHYSERCDLMNYNGDLSLKQRIAKLQDDTYDLVAEFHLNAAGGQGTECYYHHKSERGKKLAEAVTDEISSTLGVKNRGAKIKLNAFRKDYFGIIRQTKPCAILIETVFIDSSDLDTVKTADGQRKCGEAIARAVAKARGLTETEKPSEPKPTPKPTPKPEQSKPKPNFIEPVVWQNGSTKENAYSDNALKNRIGSLNKKEKADSFGKYNGKTLVVYNISGGHKKAGFVKYEGKNPKKVGEWGADYQNGSTPENVYSSTDLSDKIGSLDPYEKCKCLAKYKGRYLVCYKVNGTNTYKTGFVKYNGKVE